MSFQGAVQSVPSVAAAYCPGFQALKATDRARLSCNDPRDLRGSVDVDAALSAAEPNAARWDYCVGIHRNGSEIALWIEVHPASSDHVGEMVNKLQWLKQWLATKAHALRIISSGEFYWVATSGEVTITANSQQAKVLAKAGLSRPTKHLRIG